MQTENLNNGGEALNQLLDQAKDAAGAAASAPGDDLFLGMTFTGLMLAGFFGLVGTAYLVYAKKQQRAVIGVCGIALIVFTYFVSSTWLILLLGTLFMFLPQLLKRVGVDF